MLTRARAGTILTLALPIVGSMVSQNVLNLVDTAMVGQLGKEALAAVGVASFANFASQSVILGLSAGVQATAARRLGEGREGELATPLNGGLFLALVLGLPLALVLWWLAPDLFPYVNEDPKVIAQGVPYYRARLAGVVAVGMNFSFRGYWNGVNLSRMYMRTILLMHACNVVLNYALIFGHFGAPAMGAEGAGWGTTLSMWIGTAYYFYLGREHAGAAGFLAKLPGRDELGALLKLSAPNSVQQLFFSSGLLALYWIVGKVGTAELAAANVLINLTLVAILPAMGLGLGAASLVGQALGRGDPEDARAWGWDVVKLGVMLLTMIGLPALLAPDLLLRVFLHEPETLDVARLPLRLIGASIGLEAVGMVLMNALLGAGDSRSVMQVSIAVQWGLFLPVAYLVGPHLGYGLLGIWIANMGYRALLAISFAALWVRGDWAKVQV